MLKNKNAFTLAEVMVTLAVFGILAALLLPAIANVRPNKNKVMFRKAYYVAERMVFELVNDEDFYPTQGETVGFTNTVLASYLGHTYEGQDKFCGLFARKVNTTDDDEIKCETVNSTPVGNGTYSTPSFITTDGVAWYMPISDFTDTETIYVDVNTDKEPNCEFDSNNCKDPDIFEIKVEPDGKMLVEGEKEKEYLKSHSSMR